MSVVAFMQPTVVINGRRLDVTKECYPGGSGLCEGGEPGDACECPCHNRLKWFDTDAEATAWHADLHKGWKELHAIRTEERQCRCGDQLTEANEDPAHPGLCYECAETE